MLDVLLLNAPVRRRSPHARLAPPLGLAYLGAVLRLEGFSVSAVDFNVSGLNLQRLDRLLENPPALAGLSAHTETYDNALAIARRIKSLSPETKVVLGGPHPTLLPERVLAEEAVDFVVVGEGERTLLELTQHLVTGLGSLDRIAGLGYKNGSGLKLNAARGPLPPDSLPYPARDLFPLEFYQDRWNVLTARGGCPFKCPFCSASALWQGRRRPRKPEFIGEEVRLLAEEYGAEYVFFADDIFTLNHQWVRQVLQSLGRLHSRPDWGCATRVDMVNERLLGEMAAAGCRAIQFGVESGSQPILDSVKGIQRGQVIAAVKHARAAGIDVACSFMIPFPDDTRETIRETKELMQQLAKMGAKVLLSFTTPYPGTYFHDHAAELGLKLLTGRWEEFDAKHNVLETRHLSAAEIEELVGELVREVGLVKAAG